MSAPVTIHAIAHTSLPYARERHDIVVSAVEIIVKFGQSLTAQSLLWSSKDLVSLRSQRKIAWKANEALVITIANGERD